MTRTSRASSRLKEQLRNAWIPDSPSERDRCPDTFDLEAFIRRQEAADARTATPAA